MRMVITGATGYIGSCLTHLALKHGHEVITASRERPSSFAGPWFAFDLSSADSFTLPTGTDAVVHLAAKTTHTDCLEEENELVAAKLLILSTQKAGAKFIFVSSQTARADAPTAYGRSKWRIEQEVLSAGGWVVRPGQVYGGELRGLFGMLVNTVKQLPILPAFVPAPKIQPIHVTDLAEGLLRIAESAELSPGIFSLGAVEPVSFSTFLKAIAKSRLHCRRGFVPVPVAMINALAGILGEPLRTRLGLVRLKSLFNLPVMETQSDLNRLGLVLRPLPSGMHPSGNDRRRGLLREGRSLLSYILKKPPGSTVLRRYVHAVEHLRGGKALALPAFFLNYPFFLSLLDGAVWTNNAAGDEFIWRLDAATLLAEATPSGAYRFLGRGHGVLRSLLSITGAVLSELCWRIARMLFSPLVRFTLTGEKGAL